jgi:hypothetical protein
MSASVQVCDRGQQLAGQMIFGYKGVYQVQCRLGDTPSFGEQDDWCLRHEPSNFQGDLLPVHPGHKVVKNYNVNRMDGS